MPHEAYGWQHQKVRERLLREQIGFPCPLCGDLMVQASDLDLDHSDPSAKLRGEPGDRLAHRWCNRSSTKGSHAPSSGQVEWSSVEW